MQISVSGHHVEVTQALKDYVARKLERLNRHADHGIIKAHITLTVEGIRQKAEANFHMAGNDFFAHCVSEDMYAAIDRLADKLDRQLARHKAKSKNHKVGPDEYLP